MSRSQTLLLVILDGFGISLEKEGNPVAAANLPHLNEIEARFPFTTLQASGVAVGLPWGEAGNSEVGHLTMGAGKVLYHHLPRIINAITDDSFFQNEAFLKAAAHVRAHHGRLHLAGLVSSGSVHSYIDHLEALLEFTKRENLAPVFLHVFTDGKDAPPEQGTEFLAKLEQQMKKEWPHAQFASVIGRFFAMDRDENWDRIRACYELMTKGQGTAITSPSEYLRASYREGITDADIKPAVVTAEGGVDGIIRENDAIIFFNFREDSMREITRAFADESFDHFPREKIANIFVATMTEYEKNLFAEAAFPTLDIAWPLARVLSDAGLRHLHIAETEKYAHVTYFFNGGQEKPFPGEERILVPSISTAHIDEAPAMRAGDITQKIVAELPHYQVIIANFANADMVGHSGNFQAAVQAVETLDKALGELVKATFAQNAVMVVTADHGNIEIKRNPITGQKITEHSINPVPFYLVGKEYERRTPRTPQEIDAAKKETGGILIDVAPTIIELLGLKKPHEMTGESLLHTLLRG